MEGEDNSSLLKGQTKKRCLSSVSFRKLPFSPMDAFFIIAFAG